MYDGDKRLNDDNDWAEEEEEDEEDDTCSINNSLPTTCFNLLLPVKKEHFFSLKNKLED